MYIYSHITNLCYRLFLAGWDLVRTYVVPVIGSLNEMRDGQGEREGANVIGRAGRDKKKEGGG